MPDRLKFLHLYQAIGLALVLALSGCATGPADHAPTGHPTLLGPAISITAAPRAARPTPPAPTRTFQPTAAAVPQPTATLQPVPTLAAGDCGVSPVAQRILQEATADRWLEWVKQLSGAEPVTVGGQTVTFSTRNTVAMFGRAPSVPSAFDFVHQVLLQAYPAEQVEVQPYTTAMRDGTKIRGSNLILTLPGTSRAEEMVILSAHLDSTSRNPQVSAPGAEDNGSGSAALLEAARLFRGHQFQRTVQLIWFTGEEQGLLGSKAFVKEDVKDPSKIVGVVNLDMFGYDSDGDRCFELHVGSLPASDRIGQCFVQSIQAYALGLPRYDYLTTSAVTGSDHSSFWSARIGAVEVLENLFDQQANQPENPNACLNADPNPNYHTLKDTYDQLNPDSAIRLVRAALATVMGLAGIVE